jgi:hypothetical protein
VRRGNRSSCNGVIDEDGTPALFVRSTPASESYAEAMTTSFAKVDPTLAVDASPATFAAGLRPPKFRPSSRSVRVASDASGLTSALVSAGTSTVLLSGVLTPNEVVAATSLLETR